jgi:hypothetical protein
LSIDVSRRFRARSKHVGKDGAAELTVRVYSDKLGASDVYSPDSGNKGFLMDICRADANGVGFVSNTWVADIDIGIAGRESATGKNA